MSPGENTPPKPHVGHRSPAPAWLGPVCLAGAFALVLGLAVEASLRFLRVEAPMGELETGSSGDFVHYYHAARAVLDGQDIYAAGINWYGYLPMFAVIIAPLALLPFAWAAVVWTVCNAAFVLGSMWLGGRDLARRFGVLIDPALVPAVMLLVALVMSDKIRAQFRLGQTDAFILMSLTLGLVCFGRRPVLCGLMIGIAANIKYQGLVFLPYLLIRRRWAEAFWAAAWSAGIALSTALVFGWETNLRYLSIAVSSLLEGVIGSGAGQPGKPRLFPLDWERSVSIPSTMARAAERLGLGEGVVMPAVAALVLVAIGVGWVIYARRGRRLWAPHTAPAPDRPAVEALEWCGLIAGVLAFSPQTTGRHLTLLILPMVLAAVLLLGQRPASLARVRVWPVLVAVLALSAGLRLPPGSDSADAAVWWWRSVGGVTWVHLVFFYTMLWVGLGWAARLRDGPAPPPDAPPARA